MRRRLEESNRAVPGTAAALAGIGRVGRAGRSDIAVALDNEFTRGSGATPAGHQVSADTVRANCGKKTSANNKTIESIANYQLSWMQERVTRPANEPTLTRLSHPFLAISLNAWPTTRCWRTPLPTPPRPKRPRNSPTRDVDRDSEGGGTHPHGCC